MVNWDKTSNAAGLANVKWSFDIRYVNDLIV